MVRACLLDAGMRGTLAISWPNCRSFRRVKPPSGSGYSYRNFPRREGLTVEQSLAGLGRGVTADVGVQIPDALVTDCVRLCCSLCLLENDPSIIEPDVLSKDRGKFEDTGDEKYVEKAHRRGRLAGLSGGESKWHPTTGDRT